MNAKTFSILAIITILIVIAAAMLTQQKPTTPEPEKFFPNLMSTLNDVTEINIRTKDNTIALTRSDEQWLLKEKHNYPVTADKVNKLLFGAADLTIVEAKTSNPALYSKIGVEDQSTLLTLKKGESEISLIIGKDRIAKIDSTRREIYVRKPDDKQAWLTLGQLPLEKTPKDWLEQEIINLDSIRRVSINDDNIVIFKDTPEDENYQLADLPENGKIKAAHILNNIASTLTGLKLDDVIPATDIEFDDKANTRAVFTTFDGLEVTMTITKKEEKYYAKFAAKADAQADSLNAKFKGWAYELAKYKVENLEKKRDELIETVEEEKPAVETNPAAGEELPIPFKTTPSDENAP
jgi:hypothetical protein